MRIAQVAPLTEAVPPKLYGGTERVVHWRNMAEGAAPRRIGSRSQCVTHGDAGTRPAEM